MKDEQFMKKPYDFVIVGSGLFGAVFAREATDRGYKFLRARIKLG